MDPRLQPTRICTHIPALSLSLTHTHTHTHTRASSRFRPPCLFLSPEWPQVELRARRWLAEDCSAPKPQLLRPRAPALAPPPPAPTQSHSFRSARHLPFCSGPQWLLPAFFGSRTGKQSGPFWAPRGHRSHRLPLSLGLDSPVPPLPLLPGLSWGPQLRRRQPVEMPDAPSPPQQGTGWAPRPPSPRVTSTPLPAPPPRGPRGASAGAHGLCRWPMRPL